MIGLLIEEKLVSDLSRMLPWGLLVSYSFNGIIEVILVMLQTGVA